MLVTKEKLTIDFQTVKICNNMKDEILDCMNYVKNTVLVNKKLRRMKFLHMKKNDESDSEEEIKKMIPTLISLNQLEQRGIATKSYFIPSLVLALQTHIMDEDEPSFSEMQNPINDKTNVTVGNTQKDENLVVW